MEIDPEATPTVDDNGMITSAGGLKLAIPFRFQIKPTGQIQASSAHV